MSAIFSPEVLVFDEQAEIERLCTWIRNVVGKQLGRRGAVVGLSGGIDSSVVGALCVKALGPKRVFGLLLPEHDSSSETTPLGRQLVEHLGIDHREESISAILEGANGYHRRDESIRQTLPEYGEGWKNKIVLPPATDGTYRIFQLVAQDPSGKEYRERMNSDSYLGVVAATNFKQRSRTMLQYYWADRLVYAVAGTPNRLEFDQGFFVKGGDGLADFKPIVHLYKTQVYALAKALELPAEIQGRSPTTDTYSLPQSQDEFYYSLPWKRMDLALWAYDHQISAAEAAPVLELDPEQVEHVYRDIESKRKVASYLHAAPVTPTTK
ncbi:MAG: NAD(+) synthase [Planctomycetota bacterium]|nr:MAG: NAD(+) synthase [Planctomycetota bacterium]